MEGTVHSVREIHRSIIIEMAWHPRFADRLDLVELGFDDVEVISGPEKK
jgi:hypothetical protein